jgi:type II secretory pathway component PulF
MSRDAENPVPPGRRGPRARRPGDPEPASPGDEPTTWKPNPKRNSSASAATRHEVRTEPIEGGPGWWERILFGRVGSGQLAAYCRQFASYLEAGVDIVKTLSSLEKQFSMTALGPVTKRLLDGVRRGDSLAEAVEREPKAFDPLFLSMIRVAEARGGVPETLLRMSRHYEARQSLIRQARSAMIYPVIVLIVAAGVVALLSLWLLPMFITLLADISRGQDVNLPLPSRMLMAFSRFVQSLGWWLIPLVMLGLPVLFLQLYRTRPGKQVMDNLVLWVPGFGLLLRKIETTRFARTLSALLGAGVDVGTSLDLTADVMQLDPYRRAVRRARGAVMEGGEISTALLASRRFGPDVIAVVSSGEETGKLPETLDRLADDYEEQVAYMVRNMGQLVQPLIMILLGGLVLFIILAVFLPYLAILTNLSR